MENAASWGVFGALQKMTSAFSGLLPYLILLSFIAGIWLYYVFVARHVSENITVMQWIQKFLSFDRMLWPVLSKVLYIAFSVFILFCGVITIFAVNVFGGFVGMVLLLILVRVLFELLMILFSIHEKLVGDSLPIQKDALAVLNDEPAQNGEASGADLVAIKDVRAPVQLLARIFHRKSAEAMREKIRNHDAFHDIDLSADDLVDLDSNKDDLVDDDEIYRDDNENNKPGQ